MERPGPRPDSPDTDASYKQPKSRSLQMMGAGLEMAVTVGLAIGAGSFLDRLLKNDDPIFAAVFALLGFGLAMTRFIIRANRMTRQTGSVKPDSHRTINKTDSD